MLLPGAAADGEITSKDSVAVDTGDGVALETVATNVVLDIVVVVDNSGSMGLEIATLQDELYDHLVGPQIASGVDVRVVVVSKFGDLPSESMCFEAPLSSIPVGGCGSPPALPGNTDLFKHYSVEIGSHTAWCQLIDTFDGTVPDEFGLAPGGWVDWLREGSLKLVLMVTDDRVVCGSYDDGNSVPGGTSAAASIDMDLLALSPLHFGTSSNRTYVVHCLVGVDSLGVLPPTSPVSAVKCFSAMDPGTGHQAMSVLTEGLRFPSCSTTEYDGFLEAVSRATADRNPIFTDDFESGSSSAWSSSSP